MVEATYLLLLLLPFVTYSQAGHDIDVCKPNLTNIDDTFPKLDPQYSVFIEANYISERKTVHFTEYHDVSKSADVIKRRHQDSQIDVYLFRNTGEMFVIQPKQGLCVISGLWQKPNRYLFGENIATNEKVFSFAGAMELAENNFFKVKEKVQITDRGIRTLVWSACQYLPSMKATVKMTWHFAMEKSGSIRPIQLHMKGRYSYNIDFEYQFEFFHYKPYIMEDKPIFETPRGTVCTGRKMTKPLPEFPQVFSYTTEIVNDAKDSIQYMEEEYDTINQLVRFTYKPIPESLNSFGAGKLTKIHDYNIDVAYIIDDIQGNCTIMPIFGNDDDIRGDNLHRRMATAKEFFRVDKGQFTYEGVQNVRGFDCDVWIAHINSYPQFPLMTGAVIEWYFTTPVWYAGKGDQAEPKLLRQVNVDTNEVLENNIYKFSEKEPDILLFDVTACFKFKDKYKFVFSVAVKYSKMIQRHLASFKRGIVTALIENVQISPMRVNKINVEFEKTQVSVSFEIHDKVTISGGSPTKKKQKDLKQVVSELKTIFTKGAFTTRFKNGRKHVIIIDSDGKPLIIQEVKGKHQSSN